MARLAFVAATTEHAEAIAPQLRFRDTYGLSGLEVAAGAIGMSSHAWAIVSPSGSVLALFGIYRGADHSSIIGDAGVPREPWLLVSIEVIRTKRAAWRASRAALDLLLEQSPSLHGRVDATSRQRIAWLRRLGFSIGGPHNMPPAFPFVTFHIEKRAT